MSRRILILAGTFPPVNLSSVHRTTAFCRHLAHQDWEVTVVTRQPPTCYGTDASLLDKVPQSVRVRRVRSWASADRKSKADTETSTYSGKAKKTGRGATEPSVLRKLRQWILWWLQVPDNRMGWFMPAVCAGCREIRRARPDVIYSTAPIWTSHVVAMCLSRLFRIPWVADCRDPWQANPFRDFPYRIHRQADGYLEGLMVRFASNVICNTPGVKRDFVARYPRYAAKFEAIPNGYDRQEAQRIRDKTACLAEGRCRLVHAGRFYGSRSPLPFLAALKQMVETKPELREHVLFEHIGPVSWDGTSLHDLVVSQGVEDIVRCVGSVGHHEALARISGADVAVAIGLDGQGSHLQIPRKLYEYIGLRKPILVTGGTCQAVEDVVGGSQYRSIWYVRDLSDPQALGAVLQEIVGLWLSGRLAAEVPACPEFSEDYMAERIESFCIKATSGGPNVAKIHAAYSEVTTC